MFLWAPAAASAARRACRSFTLPVTPAPSLVPGSQFLCHFPQEGRPGFLSWEFFHCTESKFSSGDASALMEEGKGPEFLSVFESSSHSHEVCNKCWIHNSYLLDQCVVTFGLSSSALICFVAAEMGVLGQARPGFPAMLLSCISHLRTLPVFPTSRSRQSSFSRERQASDHGIERSLTPAAGSVFPEREH